MKFKLISIDGSYTGILNGNIFVSDSLTKEQLVRLTSEDVTAEEIIEIFNPKLVEIRESNREVQSLVDVLLDSGLFEEKNGSYYRVGNPISVPKMLLEKYKSLMTNPDLSNEEYANQLQALDNFWLKCSLNPSAETREDLFGFIERGEFLITPKGYFVAARRLKKIREENLDLVKFISESWLKIKGQKKGTKNYTVCQNDGVYYLQKNENADGINIGNLQDLYDNISVFSENMFTDGHTGTMKITLGKPVPRMKEEDCDNDRNKTCSRGYHFTSLKYLNQHYYAGGEAVAVLINPMDVRAIPIDYSQQKGRGLQYYPFALLTLDKDGNYIYDVETDVIESEYENIAIEELNKLLQELDSSNQVVHQLTFSDVPNQVYKTIDEYRTILESKNQSIYSELDDDGDYEEDNYDYDDYDNDWDDEEDDDEY